MTDAARRVAVRKLQADADHRKSVALMKFLSGVARKEGVAKHVYVVGGAVRNYLLGVPIKDIDVVVDSVELGRGRDSEWFAKQVADAIPVPSSLVTNQYGVAILTVKGPWELEGLDLQGEVIEIANARKESYEGAGGKGYKPTDVAPATIKEDVFRREFTFNTLLWRLLDLVDGPDKAEVIDLTGLGRSHLEEKLISTPVDPDKTFSDDPTRQLRILKFLLRYGLKISPDVAASVKRNAPKLKQMPWEAVANILVKDILDSPRASEGLRVMRSLGMLDVLVEMVAETPSFAAYLNRQLASGNRPVALLLELADVGLSDKAMEFLTPAQKSSFKAVAASLDPEEARRLLDALKRPPADNAAIIQEFALEGRDRGVLVTVARDVLLADPSALKNPVELNDRIRDRLRASLPARVASRYIAAAGKYDDIDFKPPESVADAAEKGLEYREKASPSNKGGLTPAEAGEQGIGSGVQRAVNLKNRDNATPETISKMVGFFARSEKNKSVAPENKGEPWNDKGHIAWLLWGGDPGKAWAEKVKAQMDKADEQSKTASLRVAARFMQAVSWAKRRELEFEHLQDIRQERDRKVREHMLAQQRERFQRDWNALTDEEKAEAVAEMNRHKDKVKEWKELDAKWNKDFKEWNSKEKWDAEVKDLLKQLSSEMSREGWKLDGKPELNSEGRWVVSYSYVHSQPAKGDPKLQVVESIRNPDPNIPNSKRYTQNLWDMPLTYKGDLVVTWTNNIEDQSEPAVRVTMYVELRYFDTHQQEFRKKYDHYLKGKDSVLTQEVVLDAKPLVVQSVSSLEELRETVDKLVDEGQAIILGAIKRREAEIALPPRGPQPKAPKAPKQPETWGWQNKLERRQLDQLRGETEPKAPASPVAPPSAPSPGTPTPAGERGEIIDKVRRLGDAAASANNQWMTDFSKSIGAQLAAGRTLSEKQQAVLERGFKQFRIAFDTSPVRVAARFLSSR